MAKVVGNALPVGGVFNNTPPTGVNEEIIPQQADLNGATIVNPKPLSKTIDSVVSRPEGTTPVNMTATALVRTGAGILVGMYVNSTSSGTIKFWDNTSAANPTINNTITPAVGYHPLGNAAFTTGLFATIGGTLDVTLYIIPVVPAA